MQVVVDISGPTSPPITWIALIIVLATACSTTPSRPPGLGNANRQDAAIVVLATDVPLELPRGIGCWPDGLPIVDGRWQPDSRAVERADSAFTLDAARLLGARGADVSLREFARQYFGVARPGASRAIAVVATHKSLLVSLQPRGTGASPEAGPPRQPRAVCDAGYLQLFALFDSTGTLLLRVVPGRSFADR